MTICKLCSSIPLDGDGLPTLPDWGSRTTWRYIHKFPQESLDTESIKFPFHPNLESLNSSGEECDLCRLILRSIKKAIEELRNPDKENVRRGSIDIPKQPTWELWLTRRELGDGFCVFTNCENSKDFCFVAAVGICVEEGDPLSSVYAGRPIEENPSNPKSMALVTNWVKQCNEHPNCIAERPLLPFHVIDVGNETNGYCMRLCEMEGKTGRYICLSHCWGKVTQFTTTKASFAAHTANINYNELPKSFRDAIAITRLLGIRYIWIDSICICQDDSVAWDRESAKMTSIYMNSYLTIAASAAEDSSIGCFIPRRPTKYVRIPYTGKQGISGELQAFLLPMRKEDLPDLYIDMADNINKPDHPLVTRAWAVQERVLPRRTLHFGKHQMYFECNEGFRGENGLHISWRYYSIHSKNRDSHGQVLKDDATLSLWNSLLWNYGPRSLTLSSDKLPAISGIARLFAERLDDEYMAGLWRKSLIEGLLWQGIGVHRVPKYRAPSWSWASVDGTPATGIDENWKCELLADIIDCKVELKGKNVFGEVKSGWIKIQAPLVPLILDERVDPQGTGVPYENNPKVRIQKGDPEGCHSRFDFPFSGPTGREDALAMVESLKGVDIFTLILAKQLPEDEDDEPIYHSLIVRPAEGDSSAMQRLGFIHLREKVLGECSQLKHPEERPTIMLV